MLQTFVITLREGVEAALVIAIAVAWLRKTGRLDLMPTVYRALISAVIACFLAAWGFTKIEYNEDAYEGWVLLVSAVFVFSMVIWMNRHGGKLKGEIETRLQKDTDQTGSRSGVFLFVFLMIFREGVETVLMLFGTVRLDTSGILERCSAGCSASASRCCSASASCAGRFASICKQFFQMTTVILMVVVVQLVITGLHELSESQILPASTREMALIGPIVKNDIFFFVTILALAAAMMLLEWRKRRAPKTEGLEGAALRKAQWSARRERLWMTASCAASCVFILLITRRVHLRAPGHGFVGRDAGGAREWRGANPGGLGERWHSASVSVRRCRRERAVYRDRKGRSHAGDRVRRLRDLRHAGLLSEGSEVICQNCASAIVTWTIGTKGGCNPIPLQVAHGWRDAGDRRGGA